MVTRRQMVLSMIFIAVLALMTGFFCTLSYAKFCDAVSQTLIPSICIFW